jgi:hypothetical protein
MHLAVDDHAHWAAGLTSRERTVLRVSERLRFVLGDWAGACYWVTFFLKYNLEVRHQIVGTAVLGFINGGTGNVFAGHAWLETDDRMTDIALCRPLNPHRNPAGPVTILGRVLVPGWPYTYHRSNPPQPLPQAVDDLLRDQMCQIARSNHQIRTYLDYAPPGDLNYKRLAALVEHPAPISESAGNIGVAWP